MSINSLYITTGIRNILDSSPLKLHSNIILSYYSDLNDIVNEALCNTKTDKEFETTCSTYSTWKVTKLNLTAMNVKHFGILMTICKTFKPLELDLYGCSDMFVDKLPDGSNKTHGFLTLHRE